MNLALKQTNSLPASTWNLLGVNSADINEIIPEISPYSGEEINSPLPAGVTVSVKKNDMPEIETGMGNEARQFAEKNKNCGITLRAKAGTRAEKPVILKYEISDKNPSVVDVSSVIAEEGSEITVVMEYSSEKDISGFHGGLTKLYAEKGAVIHLIQVQTLSGDCTHFDNIGAVAEENAEIDVVQAELGGKNAFAGCKTKLLGRNSRLNIDTVYFGDRSRSIDINYIAEHIGKKTKSEIHVNGALMDESRKIFRGTIDFIRGAKNAVGHESEYNLLFSPKVRSRTAPLILCSEEDVEGQHAAATGKIDADKLFYLMSRGLSEIDAKKLIIKAQFQPTVEKIPDAELQSAVFDYVKERLDSIEPLS